MRIKTNPPRKLLVVVVLAWAPCALAQDYPPSPMIADIVIEDARKISFGDGDNFPMTWADDGRLYTNLVYNPGIQRYLLITLPWERRGNYDRYLGIFDAPHPWGPWTIAAEKTDFDEARYHPRIPSKWISRDGLTFWYNFSVLERGDKSRYRFNLEKAVIKLRDSGTTNRREIIDSTTAEPSLK